MGLFNYKILAFCVLFKKHRKNSIWFKSDGFNSISKKLGLSYNTIKKYYAFCVKKQILVPYGEHMQFVKITKIIEKLNLDLNKYCKFFSWYHYECLSFKCIYDQILFSRVMLNFKQQKFNIVQKNKSEERIKLVENSKNTHPNVIKSIIKKFGSISKAKSSISKNKNSNIVTGKNHLSALINCSNTSSLNILKRMQQKGLIKRTPICKLSDIPYSFTGYDFLKSKNQVVVPSPKMEMFYISLGSSIELL